MASIPNLHESQISFDIAKQLGHGALASGILVAASQVFQPILALLARWLVIGTSYLVAKNHMNGESLMSP